MKGFSFDGRTLRMPAFEPTYPVNFKERIKKGVDLINSGNPKAANAYLSGLSREDQNIVKTAHMSNMVLVRNSTLIGR